MNCALQKKPNFVQYYYNSTLLSGLQYQGELFLKDLCNHNLTISTKPICLLSMFTDHRFYLLPTVDHSRFDIYPLLQLHFTYILSMYTAIVRSLLRQYVTFSVSSAQNMYDIITLISRLLITPDYAVVLYHTSAARKCSWCIPPVMVV